MAKTATPVLVLTSQAGTVHVLQAATMTAELLDEIGEAFIGDVLYSPMQTALRLTFGRVRYRTYAVNRAAADGSAVLTFSGKVAPDVFTYRGKVVRIADSDRGLLSLTCQVHVPHEVALPKTPIARLYRAGSKHAS